MTPIRVAIAGIGNCASSLVQGLHYYRAANGVKPVPGLLHGMLGRYAVHDIRVACGFDVDARKIGLDVGRAIYQPPNSSTVFANVPELGAPVYMGPVHDGYAAHLDEYAESVRPRLANAEPVDVADVLRRHRADVLIGFLPSASHEATYAYANACLEAGAAFINCGPTALARDPAWAGRFAKAGLPLLGDDVKAQIGPTMVHRVLSHLFESRGVQITRTYQINAGGTSEFLNALDRPRRIAAQAGRTHAVQTLLANPPETANLHVGSSDYVPWLKDNAVSFLRLEGRKFADVPIEVDARLSIEEGPSVAGVAVDLVRLARLALDRRWRGAVTDAACFFKQPPEEFSDPQAIQRLRQFVAQPGARD